MLFFMRRFFFFKYSKDKKLIDPFSYHALPIVTRETEYDPLPSSFNCSSIDNSLNTLKNLPPSTDTSLS